MTNATPYIFTHTSLVESFHRKFGVPVGSVPQHLPAEYSRFRIQFMREELEEYERAVRERNLVKQLDALVDLDYVLRGTAIWQGLPFDRAMLIVHQHNMRKERARPDDPDARSFFDVRKPLGWQPPEPVLEALLLQHGWDGK